MNQNRNHPLLLSVLGLMLVVFGIADIIFVNKEVGMLLLMAGVVLGVYGIVRYRKMKK